MAPVEIDESSIQKSKFRSRGEKMECPINVRLIAAPQTHALRLEILRAGLPPESAIFPGDEAATTRHFGAFEGENLVGIATLLEAPVPGTTTPALQLRGMAVSPALQGAGIGRVLVEACRREAVARAIFLLWCNARSDAAVFYEKMGFEKVGAEFEIESAGPHFVMQWRLR